MTVAEARKLPLGALILVASEEIFMVVGKEKGIIHLAAKGFTFCKVLPWLIRKNKKHTRSWEQTMDSYIQRVSSDLGILSRGGIT